MATTSLVLGIVGLVLFWACFAGGRCGLVAVVLGIIGLRRSKQPGLDHTRGQAVGGIVTGGIAIVAGHVVPLAFLLSSDSATVDLGDIDSDPSDGFCDESRFVQDPDC